MPTDNARRTVEIDAPPDQIRDLLHDVELQPQWIREIQTATVLEKFDDGLPAVTKLTARTPVGGDEYTLAYVHGDGDMTWSLVEGRLQSAQDGRFSWQGLAHDRTLVAYELTITHGLPLPGFVRRRVIGDLVSGTLGGLKKYVEA